jgi:hypothetical protein
MISRLPYGQRYQPDDFSFIQGSGAGTKTNPLARFDIKADLVQHIQPIFGILDGELSYLNIALGRPCGRRFFLLGRGFLRGA